MVQDLPVELRPKITVAIIPSIISALIIFGFMFGYVYFLSEFLGLKSKLIFWSSFLPLLFFLLIPLMRILNLKSRKYQFYEDKVVFYEGFLNQIQRTVPYHKVTDLVLHKSVWDRMFKTGTIRLVTAGHVDVVSQTGPFGGMMVGGGISIQYIEKPDEVYEYISKLLKIN